MTDESRTDPVDGAADAAMRAFLNSVSPWPVAERPIDAADAALQERIWSASAARLGLRRSLRRGRSALCVLVVAYAAFALGRSNGRRDSSPAETRIMELSKAAEPLESMSAPTVPEDIELQARAADVSDGPALYKAAGDSFLRVRGDVAAAQRCYRIFLRTATPAVARRAAPDDTWLLAALRPAVQ